MLKVTLTSVGNPDFGQDAERPVPGVPSSVAEVADIAAASQACREYIELHQLGGGNWAGGEITDEGGNLVGHVSYNGKVWARSGRDWRPGDEPIYTPGSTPGFRR